MITTPPMTVAIDVFSRLGCDLGITSWYLAEEGKEISFHKKRGLYCEKLLAE